MNSSTKSCCAGTGNYYAGKTIWLGRHLITVCCMFSGFQWRTEVEIMGVETVGVQWGMTDLSNWCAQRALCKKPRWINIHDVPLNLITMSKQVKRAITVICSPQTQCLVCFISKPYKMFFFFLIPFGFHFLSPPSPPSRHSPPLMCCFYPSLIVHV